MDRPLAFVWSRHYALFFLHFCQKWLVAFLKVSFECSCSITFDENDNTFSSACVSTTQTSLTKIAYETAKRAISIFTKNVKKKLFVYFFILLQTLSTCCSNYSLDLLFDTFVGDALLKVSAVKRDGAFVNISVCSLQLKWCSSRLEICNSMAQADRKLFFNRHRWFQYVEKSTAVKERIWKSIANVRFY